MTRPNLKMYNTNFLYGVMGNVAEIPSPNKAIIHFELHGVSQTAFLGSHRFYKDGKRLPDNQNLNKVLKVGHKVKFSCHINDNPDPGQCKWYVTNCWRHIESEHKIIMSSGMMNVAGTVTDLKQRHGTLIMIDLLESEHRVHFLASKVYLFGKRLAASKPLTSHLQIDDKVYFDAIPCFPEENNQNCNWFATCVHKGKKPELFFYKDPSKTEKPDIEKEKILNQKILNQFVESIKSEDKTVRGETPTDHRDLLINGLHKDVDNLILNSDSSPTRSQLHESANDSTGVYDSLSKQNKTLAEEKQTPEDSHPKVEPSRSNAQMLHDIKLLTNDPRVVFAISEGIILDVINEEYGVILGEFQRNVFQSILFHRSNAFLFKMSLAHSKLNEIFIEGDRVRFIAVEAPKTLVCDWIATQVSVASDEQEDEDGLEDDISEDQTE